MKKSILLVLMAMALVGGSIGCQSEAPKEEVTAEETTDRTVKIDKCGLQYEAPEAWIPYEQTNMIPMTNTTTEGALYGQVVYYYVTDEGMEELATVSESMSTEGLLHPFGEVLVFRTENLESDRIQEEFAQYGKQEKVAEQQGYVYYVLSEYTGDVSMLTGEDAKAYVALSDSMEALQETISVYPFDETEVAEAIDQIKRTISFVTTTLEGEPIDSSIFGNSDLTMVNFWASYCYPDINETETLQQLKETLVEEYPTVQLIQVVIDTPTAEAEEIAKQAKIEANADFISIMPDATFGNWIVQNLEGLPTTVFVNNQGQIVGEQIQGVKSKEEYLAAIKEKMGV